MPARAISLLLLATLLLVLPGAAFAKGRLGFGVQMAMDGAILKEVKVSDLRPNGPTATAGLRGGKAMSIDIVAGPDQ